MAWPGQKIEAKEIIGMEPAELKEKLDKAVSKEDLNSFKSELLETVKESLKSIEVKAPPVIKKEPETPEEKISFLEDEDGAFNQRARNLALATCKNQADILKMSMLPDKPYYKAFKDEIDQLLNAQSIQNQANPAIVENVYYTVVGRHSDDIKSGKAKTAEMLLESATNGGGHKHEEKKDELSEKELATAKKFGIDPKKYQEAKGKLEFTI